MSSLDCNGYEDNPTHLEICTIRSRAQPWLFVLQVRGTNALLCKETFILSSQKSCVACEYYTFSTKYHFLHDICSLISFPIM